MSAKKTQRHIEDVNRTIRLLIDASESAYSCATDLTESRAMDVMLTRMGIELFERSKTILMRAEEMAEAAGQLHLWSDLLADNLKDVTAAIARAKRS